MADLIDLQNIIVDPRYAARGLRDFQNFMGETIAGYREAVHFICPRPADIQSLMGDWAGMTAWLRGTTDPVVAAALVAFGFVFLHPFEDGNGRIHRFLIHHVLAAEGFTPSDILFPVSAAIVRDMRGYDAALKTFSKAILPFIDWEWMQDKTMQVANDTAYLYRYFDATPLVEFLYAKIADTVNRDLKEELDYVAVYDAVLRAVKDQVDMPDRRATLLVQFLMQNRGTLSKNKRKDFPELHDHEIEAMEASIKEIMQREG